MQDIGDRGILNAVISKMTSEVLGVVTIRKMVVSEGHIDPQGTRGALGERPPPRGNSTPKVPPPRGPATPTLLSQGTLPPAFSPSYNSVSSLTL